MKGYNAGQFQCLLPKEPHVVYELGGMGSQRFTKVKSVEFSRPMQTQVVCVCMYVCVGGGDSTQE